MDFNFIEFRSIIFNVVFWLCFDSVFIRA